MGTTVFTLIDGMRPDAIAAAGCTNIPALQERGAYTLSATSIMPSITLPCHMSIFHSVPPTRHGVTTNDWAPMARPLPGLVEKARLADRKCAFFYNWEPLRNLSQPGNLDYVYFCESSKAKDGDHVTVAEALRYIRREQPDFVFVYLGTVDEFGHRYGWMQDGYLAQLAHVDEAVGQLLDGLPTDVSLLLQSDHGGHDRSHGTSAPEDMTIPWMVSGPEIRQNYEIPVAVSLLDTAPTLARLLDVDPHFEWEGRCVQEAFME